MRAEDVIELVERVVSVDSYCRERDVLKSALSDLRRLTSWASAREAKRLEQFLRCFRGAIQVVLQEMAADHDL